MSLDSGDIYTVTPDTNCGHQKRALESPCSPGVCLLHLLCFGLGRNQNI